MVVRGSLLVCFQDPFWVGIVHLEAEAAHEIGRVVFGAEPTNAQLLEWVRTSYKTLAMIPVPVPAAVDLESPQLESPRVRNPKRAKREAARALGQRAATRAQEAVKEAYAGQKARQPKTGDERDAEAERRWAVKVEKRKQKHRGH